jgi:hypothetical protein
MSVESGNCQLFSAIKRAWARNQIGIQDRQIGNRCVSALLQVAIFGLLLERVDRRTLAFFDATTMTADAIGAGYATERSVRACIDALVEGGQIEATLTRGRGYFIKIVATPPSSRSGQEVQVYRTSCPTLENDSGHTVQEKRTQGPEELDTGSGTLLCRSPQEDPHGNPTEDNSLPLATSQAPSTSRSPVVATAPKARRRATRPKVEPLVYEALTAKEREVHDFIVGDALLVQICQAVPQLSRDLVEIATIDGVVVIDVIRELRKAVQWNRDNAGTPKAWKTTGGNRGLRSWIDRASDNVPIDYTKTPSRPNTDLGNSYLNQDTPVPPTPAPIVELPRWRTARFA